MDYFDNAFVFLFVHHEVFCASIEFVLVPAFVNT